MTIDQLRAAGEAMYGAAWQSDLARALGIDPRRVREWIGRDSVPAWAPPEIATLLIERGRAALALGAALRAGTQDGAPAAR